METKRPVALPPPGLLFPEGTFCAKVNVMQSVLSYQQYMTIVFPPNR